MLNDLRTLALPFVLAWTGKAEAAAGASAALAARRRQRALMRAPLIFG
jgi:hypothetical protein